MQRSLHWVLLPYNFEVSMPGLVRKLVIVTGAEGLILNPPSQRSHRSLQVKYTTLEVSSIAYSKYADPLLTAEVYGIVGSQLPMQVTESFTNS